MSIGNSAGKDGLTEMNREPPRKKVWAMGKRGMGTRGYLDQIKEKMSGPIRNSNLGRFAEPRVLKLKEQQQKFVVMQILFFFVYKFIHYNVRGSHIGNHLPQSYHDYYKSTRSNKETDIGENIIGL